MNNLLYYPEQLFEKKSLLNRIVNRSVVTIKKYTPKKITKMNKFFYIDDEQIK